MEILDLRASGSESRLNEKSRQREEAEGCHVEGRGKPRPSGDSQRACGQHVSPVPALFSCIRPENQATENTTIQKDAKSKVSCNLFERVPSFSFQPKKCTKPTDKKRICKSNIVLVPGVKKLGLDGGELPPSVHHKEVSANPNQNCAAKDRHLHGPQLNNVTGRIASPPEVTDQLASDQTVPRTRQAVNEKVVEPPLLQKSASTISKLDLGMTSPQIETLDSLVEAGSQPPLKEEGQSSGIPKGIMKLKGSERRPFLRFTFDKDAIAQETPLER